MTLNQAMGDRREEKKSGERLEVIGDRPGAGGNGGEGSNEDWGLRGQWFGRL
jgi:hypothetical protein